MPNNKSLLMSAVPGAALAIMLVFAVSGSDLVGTRAAIDSVGPHGYVTVTVTRDGLEIYHHEDHNLITDGGRDFISAQIGSTSPSGNGANYIALSSDTGAPTAGDTTLAGEITTGGLARAQGEYAHTNGQNTFTIIETFTASATHNDVQKAGLFTASSGGTMVAENTFASVDLASGDQLTITWTITLT